MYIFVAALTQLLKTASQMYVYVHASLNLLFKAGPDNTKQIMKTPVAQNFYDS